MAINSLFGQLGLQNDQYLEMQRMQMMQGMRPITREEYERSMQPVNQAPAPKAAPKTTDETLLLLTEEE